MKKLYSELEVFITHNLVKITIVLIVMVVLSFFEKFPYFNTFLLLPDPWNSFLLLFLLLVVLFRLRELFSFGTALILLMIALLFSVFGKDTAAQRVGDMIYFLIWLAVIQMTVG